MELGFGYALEQKQTLSQAQIQSLEILTMDSGELEAFLQKEYLENPLLEYTQSRKEPQETPPAPVYEEQSGEEEENRGREIPGPEPEQLRRYLLSQLPGDPRTRALNPLLVYLIDCLEDTGYFSLPAEEVARQTGQPVSQVEQALALLRNLEPWGIFAPDLRGCLLKQLEMTGQQDTDLWKIVENHLPDVAAGKVSAIARQLKVPVSQVHRCVKALSRLNPRPLQGFSMGTAQYILPDVIVRRENGVLRVELNDDWVENYQLSDHYLSLMQRSQEPEVAAYFQKKWERVRFVMNSIDQRRKTILAISEEILVRQSAFFRGTPYLAPMTMGQIAQALNIHTSTVSRAIRGKYIQYPGGTIPMKGLFTASVGDGEEQAVGSDGIKNRIRTWISQEDPGHPLSDQALADRMKEEHIQVSRRTVTKYREELGIPSSQERKWKK